MEGSRVTAGHSGLSLWRRTFVVITLLLLPLEEIWNWYSLLSNLHEIVASYKRPPLWSLTELRLYSLVVLVLGVRAGWLVLYRLPKANSSAIMFLWVYLAVGILHATVGGIIFPFPAIRQDVAPDFAAYTMAASIGSVVVHLLVFGIFYVVFRRAGAAAASAVAARPD